MRRRQRLLLLLLREDDASTERQEPLLGPQRRGDRRRMGAPGEWERVRKRTWRRERLHRGAGDGLGRRSRTRHSDCRTVGTSRRKCFDFDDGGASISAVAARPSAAAGRDRALFFNGLPEKLNLVIYSYPYAYVAHCWATGKKTWPTVGVSLPILPCR